MLHTEICPYTHTCEFHTKDIDKSIIYYPVGHFKIQKASNQLIQLQNPT